MVFGLVGLLFNIATVPGIMFGGLVQRLLAAAMDAPMAHVAIDESVEDPQDLFDMSDAEVRRHARRLDDGEAAPEGMREEFVVDHAAIDSYLGLLVVVLGPFAVSTAVALVGFLVAIPLGAVHEVLFYVVAWLAFSVGAHAFPSSTATAALWRRSRAGDSPVRFVGYPLVGAAVLVDLLEFLWLDAVYALVLYVAADEAWLAVLGAP